MKVHIVRLDVRIVKDFKELVVTFTGGSLF